MITSGFTSGAGVVEELMPFPISQLGRARRGLGGVLRTTNTLQGRDAFSAHKAHTDAPASSTESLGHGLSVSTIFIGISALVRVV